MSSVQEQALLELSGLSKVYREGDRERTVFRDLNIAIARGEAVALVGRSGSGKSTLLNLISGIDVPSTGQVLVDGQDLTALDERRRTLFRRHHIGFIFQSYNLIPTLNVLENVLLPLELSGKLSPSTRHGATQLLEHVGLGDRQDSFPDRLSGGEQQRVAIARALVHRPSLLLADEPTGNLDAETGTQILQLLCDLLRAHAMTLVMVTHSREIASSMDRVLLLRDGRISDQTALGDLPA